MAEQDLKLEEKQVVAAKQDPKNFVVLYDKYFDQIYRYVYRRVSDKDMVEDLVSQTFYDALAHLQDFQWRGFSFGSWLYKIAHNNVLKWYRDNNKQTAPIEEGMDIPDNAVLPNEKAEVRELQAEVQEIMAKLDPEEREIVRLKFFEEVSNIEMAEIMGLSANHIGVKVFRVLKKVKSLLENN